MREQLLRVEPFTIRLRSPLDSVWRHIDFFYAGYAREPASAFADFQIEILPGRAIRRFWRRQSRFVLDGIEPFLPLPIDQAAPLFEWGLNWGVAVRPLGYLVMHAAVLARPEGAVMLPGFPGAGKSTLCASLALLQGWQLLSDELAILDPASDRLLPHPRPISLKNESIRVVGQFATARLGRIYHDTRKGDVTHAAVPEASVAQAGRPARCAWVVFPRFQAGAAPSCAEISRAEAMMLISEQSFNKERMGQAGFEALCRMLSGARCYQIVYGSTADGLALIDAVCGDRE